MTTDAALRWARTPLSAERRALSVSLLSDAELTREPTDAFLAGRLLLRELAQERGIDPRITAACADCGEEHGQPRVGDLYASIAHAKDVTVAALADHGIGIDIEPTNAAVPAEVAGGAGVRHWTAVEAVLKADGRGLRVDPRRVRIDGALASLGRETYDLEWFERDGFTIAVARATRSRTATSRTADPATSS